MQTAVENTTVHTIETLGPLERRLSVAVSLAMIEGEVGKRLARLAKTVKVPGFRPGKVPLKMVEAQYGPSVRSDVVSDAVQKSFYDAVREQNLRVAGYPRIEPKQGQDADGEALEFSAVFEVYPDIKMGDLNAIAIERPQVAVTPADVDRTLDVLRVTGSNTARCWRSTSRVRSTSAGVTATRGRSIAMAFRSPILMSG